MSGHVHISLDCKSTDRGLRAVLRRPAGAIGNTHEGGVQGFKLGCTRGKVCLAHLGGWGKELKRDFDAGTKRRGWPWASCESIGGFLLEFAGSGCGAHDANSKL
jgi:hypothetical protein